jgi:hypothetical protein
MTTKQGWLCAVAGGLLVLAAACGGGGDKDTNKKDEGSSAAIGAVPATSRAATEAARQATAAPSAAAGIGQTEQIVAADCLKGVKAYRFDGKMALKLPSGTSAGPVAGLDLNDISFSGAFVAPDRSQFKIQIAGGAFETINIGNDQWTKIASSPWIKSTGSGDALFSPDSFCRSNLKDLEKAGVKPTKDKVSGVDALKYEFDKKALGKLNSVFGGGNTSPLPDLPENTKMVLWVTEKEHWPVRVTLSGEQKTGSDPYSLSIEFNITDLNKGDISIEAPK